MFEIECIYQSTPDGLVFLPDDAEAKQRCALRVHFEPKHWYPAEPDVGAGPDFDAAIAAIEISDLSRAGGWQDLTGRSYQSAEAFLNVHHYGAMWRQAENETAESFGVAA